MTVHLIEYLGFDHTWAINESMASSIDMNAAIIHEQHGFDCENSFAKAVHDQK